MNIYRLARLATAHLPAGAIVDAVVVAADKATARALISIEETADRELARSWLCTPLDAYIVEVGPASQEYLDDLICGADEPHVLTVERKL